MSAAASSVAPALPLISPSAADVKLPDYETQIITSLAHQVAAEFATDEAQRSSIFSGLEKQLPEFREWVHHQLPIAHVFGLADDPSQFIRTGLWHLVRS